MSTPPLVDRSQATWTKLPDLARLCEYLLKTGWIEVKQDDHSIRVFGTAQFGAIAEGQGRRPYVILPAKDSFSNTESLVRDAIELIAYLRKEDTTSIISEIFRFEFDTIRQRITLPGMHGISLVIMPELIKNFRELIRTAAFLGTISGVTPLVISKNFRPSQNVNDIMQKCCFGHTFTGSFGITIDVPVQIGSNRFQNGMRYTSTPERHVVRRIAMGLNDVAHAVQNDNNTDNIISNYQYGFNANLCKIMAEILTLIAKISEGSVEYSFHWSPVLSCEEITRPVVLVPAKAIKVLTAAKNEMQRLHTKDIVTIKGKVISLHDDPEYDKSETRRRTVTMRCNNIANSNIDKIRVTLSDTDYTTAVLIHAHQSLLSVKGIIEQEGSICRLKTPHDVKEISRQSSFLDQID